MPQDITINGAQYPDVPAVQIPKTGGGTAQFDDTTDATATASEIASGKSAYVNNTRLVGTGQMVEPPLYIDDEYNSIGMGEAPTSSNFVVSTLSSSFRGQYNSFFSMPYSWSTAGVDGVQGYARIATITALGTANNLSMPIRFEVFRIYDSKPINMYLRLASSTDYNPSIEGLYYERGDGIFNNSFSAFARKTGTGTYDVYVRKETASAWIGVNTYIPAYMLYRMAVSYANDLYTFVPSDAVLATELSIVNNARHNHLYSMPDTFQTWGGSFTAAGYARIASVLFTDIQQEMPIEFQIKRRDDKATIHLFFQVIEGYGSTDPTGVGLWYRHAEGAFKNTFDAFAYKTDTSRWDIYVRKAYANSPINVRAIVPEYMASKTSISYSDALLSSVPSGATMASVVPFQTPSADTAVVRTGGASWVNTLRLSRSGNVCELYINIKTDGTTAAGSNIFTGTVNAPKPPQYITAVDCFGTNVIVATISGTTMAIRNTTPNAITSGQSLSFSFVYLSNE